MTLEELAKWHEAGETGDCDHTTAAATIRAAMGEIERLRGGLVEIRDHDGRSYRFGDDIRAIARAALNQKGPQDAG